MSSVQFIVTERGVTVPEVGVVMPEGAKHKAGSFYVVKVRTVEEIGPRPSSFYALKTNWYLVLQSQPVFY